MSFSNVKAWVGRVTSNDDPEYRGRIKVLIVGVHEFPAQNTQPDSYTGGNNFGDGGNTSTGQNVPNAGQSGGTGGGSNNAPSPTPPPDSPLPSNNSTPAANPSGADQTMNWPVAGDYKINSNFGKRPPPSTKNGKRGSSNHQGVDIAAPAGTPVLSAGGGVVIESRWSDSYGNLVIIDHGNGLTTRYAHMQSPGAAKGTRVSAGDQIGKVGNTGNSGGNHLHFETRENGTAVDPKGYLSGAKKTSASNVTQPTGGGYSNAQSGGLGVESVDDGFWAICSYPIIYGGIPKRGTLPAPSVQVGAIVHGIALDGEMMQELIVLGIVPRHEVVDKLSRNESGAGAGGAGGGNGGGNGDNTAAGDSTNKLLDSKLCGDITLGNVLDGKLHNESRSSLSRDENGNWTMNTNYSGSNAYGFSGPGQMGGAAALDSLAILIKNGNQDFINNANQKFGTTNLTRDQLIETLRGTGDINRQMQLSLSAAYTARGFNNYGWAGGLVSYYAGGNIAKAAQNAYNNGASLSNALKASDELFKQNPKFMEANKGFLPSQYAAGIAKAMGYESVDALDAACKAAQAGG